MDINGVQYPWATLEIVISGKPVPIEAVTSIRYGAAQTHQAVHAKRRDPHTLTSGNKNYSGAIRLLQSEIEALQKRMPAGKDITDLRGQNITVAYLPDEGDVGQITTDQIIDIRFENVEKGMASGDGHMEVELPFIARKINYNI